MITRQLIPCGATSRHSDLAAELLDALAHAAQAQAVRPGARVAADAVVADRQLDAVAFESKVDVELLRLASAR